MTDSSSDILPRPGTNLPELTVGDLARALKRTVEDAYGYVRVRGEISQPKRHGSGHVYLRLKDDTAVLEAVCWKGTAGRLSVRPEEGMEVVCTGRITTYPGRSQYQLVIETMELAGEGALLKMLEERKRRLAAEGLFAPERKRPLPFLPGVIGVITSPTGAVIRDILHRLNDRFPRHVLLWPVAVQGDGAAAQVAAAIRGFNAIVPGGPVPRPDLLIVARGGGSLEDLMAFNEEVVVRAAADSAIPLISAVGHETDTTLIDHASDRRAPTPTAAAEMAVPVRAELLAQVLEDGSRLHGALTRRLAERRQYVAGLARGLGDPHSLLEGAAQRLDDRAERLALSMQTVLERRRTAVRQASTQLRHPREVLGLAATRLEATARGLNAALANGTRLAAARYDRVADRLSLLAIRRQMHDARLRLDDLPRRLDLAHAGRLAAEVQRLDTLSKLLESYSYRGVLARGFALVSDSTGQPVTRAADTRPGQGLRLEFLDGDVVTRVDGGDSPAPPAPATPTPESRAQGDSDGARPNQIGPKSASARRARPAPAKPSQGSLF